MINAEIYGWNPQEEWNDGEAWVLQNYGIDISELSDREQRLLTIFVNDGASRAIMNLIADIQVEQQVFDES